MKTFLLIGIIGILLLSGCSNSYVNENEKLSFIGKPEIINFYYDGLVLPIQKDTEEYKTILSLVNKGVLDTVNLGIMKYTKKQFLEENIKTTGYALELIYPEIIKRDIIINGIVQTISYNKVFIPLNTSFVFLGNDKGYTGEFISITFIPIGFVTTLLNI